MCLSSNYASDVRNVGIIRNSEVLLQSDKNGGPQVRQFRICELNGETVCLQNENADVISDVQAVLHKQNRYVSASKTAAEILSEQNTDDMKLFLSATKRPHGTHERQFNIPCTSELGVLMPNDILNNRDIILRTRSHGRPLQRINECHRVYDALQYPILFPTGSDGWSIDLKLLNPKTGDHSNKQMSAMQYYTFKLMHRDYFNPLLYSGRLLQQYVVDQFVKMEIGRASCRERV